MKVNLLNVRISILVLITGLTLSSCSDDSTSTNDIVGTWTGGATSVTAMVGSKTLTQYYTDVVGTSATIANQYVALYSVGIQQAFTGSVQVKSDGTYISTLGGGTDTGTWSLSSDGKTLTVDSNTLSTQAFTITSLTANKLDLTVTETMSQDLNGDSVPETISTTIAASFTK